MSAASADALASHDSAPSTLSKTVAPGFNLSLLDPVYVTDDYRTKLIPYSDLPASVAAGYTTEEAVPAVVKIAGAILAHMEGNRKLPQEGLTTWVRWMVIILRHLWTGSTKVSSRYTQRGSGHTAPSQGDKSLYKSERVTFTDGDQLVRFLNPNETRALEGLTTAAGAFYVMNGVFKSVMKDAAQSVMSSTPLVTAHAFDNTDDATTMRLYQAAFRTATMRVQSTSDPVVVQALRLIAFGLEARARSIVKPAFGPEMSKAGPGYSHAQRTSEFGLLVLSGHSFEPSECAEIVAKFAQLAAYLSIDQAYGSLPGFPNGEPMPPKIIEQADAMLRAMCSAVIAEAQTIGDTNLVQLAHTYQNNLPLRAGSGAEVDHQLRTALIRAIKTRKRMSKIPTDMANLQVFSFADVAAATTAAANTGY